MALNAPVDAILVLLLALAGRGVSQEDFGYEGQNGPSYWRQQFPACGGSRQSPVDVQPWRAPSVQLPRLCLSPHAGAAWPANLTNTGHTAMAEIASGRPIALCGGPLRGRYIFQQLHFHWGQRDSMGSEHTVQGYYSAMEMHLVFYKEEYGTPARALNYSDGYTVLAVFLELSYDDNPWLEPIVTALPRITQPGAVTSLNYGLVLESLLPPRGDQYYTYKGSLTTPPCAEVVTWLLLYWTVPVSSRQVAAFRRLMSEDGPLTRNIRPLQTLGNRTISFVTSTSNYPYDCCTT